MSPLVYSRQYLRSFGIAQRVCLFALSGFILITIVSCSSWGESGKDRSSDAVVDATESANFPTLSTMEADTDIWKTLRRPLRMDDIVLEDDRRCPRSHTVWGAVPDFDVYSVGNGSIFLNVGSSDATKTLGNTAQEDGWYLSKNIWVADATYRGPIVIRGWHVRDAERVRFGAYSNAMNQIDAEICAGYSCTEELWLAAGGGARGPTPDVRHWGGYIFMRESGCYAFQVDGMTFSDIFVVEYK